MEKLKLVILICLVACSTTKTTNEDLLKNTKRMVKEGHASLYKNGAFEIPLTTVKLIPPGPELSDVVTSFATVKAKASFLASLSNIKSTYNIVEAGTLKSLKIAGKIRQRTGRWTTNISSEVSDDSLYLIKKSVATPKKTWDWGRIISKKRIKEMRFFADQVDRLTKQFGEDFALRMKQSGFLTYNSWSQGAKELDAKLSKNADTQSTNLIKGGRKADKQLMKAASGSFQKITKSGKNLDGKLNGSGKKIDEESKSRARQIYQLLSDGGTQADKNISVEADKTQRAMSKAAKQLNQGANKRASTSLSFAQQKISVGWAAFPKNVKKSSEDVKESFSAFTHNYDQSHKFRKKYSEKTEALWRDSKSHIKIDTAETWNKAKNEFTETSSSLGLTLRAIKATAWLAKLIFYDATFKPLVRGVGGAVVAGVGYVTVNAIAYPTLLIVSTGAALTEVAVELTKGTVKGVYDITAPTTVAAVAGIYSLLEWTGGKITYAGLKASSKPIEYGMKLTGKTLKVLGKVIGKSSEGVVRGAGKVARSALWTTGKTIHGTSYLVAPVATVALATGAKIARASSYTAAKLGNYGTKLGSKIIRYSSLGGAWITGKTLKATGKVVEYSAKGAGFVAANSIRYVGVPLVAVGLPAGAVSVGTVTGVVGTAASATYYGVGKATAGGTYVFGNTIAATTLVGGSTASLAAGTAVAGYEIVKGITVPSGYLMGHGVVLTYGTLTHFSAQALLGVADMSYLVLSREGPRWVVYAVQGKLGEGEDLVGGTILDLEKMKKKGEKFKVVPVSQDELKGIIESIQK